MWQQAHQISEDIQYLWAKRKAVQLALVDEVLASLPEITHETRHKFDLGELVTVTIRAMPVLDLCDSRFLSFENARMIFQVEKKLYVFEFYVARTLRVLIRTHSDESEREIVIFRRSEANPNFISEVSFVRREFESVEEPLEICKAVHRIYNILNERVENIRSFLANSFSLYASSDRRQRKSNVRLILMAHKAGTRTFSDVPREIIRRICCEVLREN